LISQLSRALASGERLAGPGRTFHENLEILVQQTGSGRAAGRALGVPETTIRRWRGGVTPRKLPDIVPTARGAATARKQAFTNLYTGVDTLKIRAEVHYSSDVRVRWLHIGREVSLRKMQGILRAWTAGQDARAERLLRNAILDDYFGMKDVDPEYRPPVTLGTILDAKVE
jgi:hypothetical protein